MVVTAYVAKISDRRSEVNCPLTFEVRPYLQVSRLGARRRGHCRRRWVDGCLEFKLPNRLDGNRVFNRHEDTRADQNLTGFSLVAQARCDVGHRPVSGVVESKPNRITILR